MVLDSSAVVAVLLDEPEAETFSRVLVRSDDPVLSAVSFVECSLVMFTRAGEDGLNQLDRMLFASGVRRVEVDERQADTVRHAWVRFGQGNAPAGLNFGDCFSYALARTLDRPLLFKGGGFARTDVAVAR
jgi:ribonuclease VapC